VAVQYVSESIQKNFKTVTLSLMARSPIWWNRTSRLKIGPGYTLCVQHVKHCQLRYSFVWTPSLEKQGNWPCAPQPIHTIFLLSLWNVKKTKRFEISCNLIGMQNSVSALVWHIFGERKVPTLFFEKKIGQDFFALSNIVILALCSCHCKTPLWFSWLPCVYIIKHFYAVSKTVVIIF